MRKFIVRDMGILHPDLMRIICILLFLALFPIPVTASTPEKVLEQNKSVVTVSVQDKDKRHIASGRGFILDKNGVIATNCTLIAKWLEQSQNRLTVETEGRLVLPVTELISSRCENNLALIKIHSDELPAVVVAREHQLEQGDQVFFLSEKTADTTPFSAITIKEAIAKNRLYGIPLPVTPKLSGSPLFNKKGEVVGAAVFLPDRKKSSSAAASLIPILKQLDNYRKPVKKEESVHVEKVPETADEFITLAFTYTKQGQYAKAIDAYRQALQRGPQSASLYNKLGAAHLINGNYSSACEAFEKAWALDPQDPVTYYNLGITNALMGEKNTAYEYYNVLKTLDADRAESLKELID
ncbi:MAG: tetratricopeptide repeat protein [Thermodesulfovibrionales bacterium]|nr:tetratricopeptide repeat protein [Thermodesulfovibrionales bacterium]